MTARALRKLEQCANFEGSANMSQAPLLTRALEKARNGRALAQKIGWSEQQVSRWKHGKEAIPPDAVAAMAVYLGENPIDALAAEKGGAWTRVAQAMRDKVSSSFDWLTLLVNPRRSLFSAR